MTGLREWLGGKSGGGLGAHTNGDAKDVVAVEVSNLTHAFDRAPGGAPVLQDISFTAHKAEFITLMGASGCGKSTLLNILGGFTQPLEGTVRCHGRAVTGPGPDRGMVFQKPALYPWYSVLDNVMFGPRALGRCRDRAGRERMTVRARELLTEMGLGGYEDHRTYELSGGMQHRVAIARTLINEPEVLLMDEPFAALDAQTRTDMQDLLLKVWDAHRPTVIFVTHDIEEGLLLADRAVVLASRPGRILEVVDVPWPRPRSFEVSMQPEFIEMRREVRQMLRGGGGSGR